MANKSKTKRGHKRAASKPVRAPKRGMYLEVVVTDNNGFELPVRVESFRDITTVGHRVAAQVRQYVRGVPLSPHTGSYSVRVFPRWIETAPAPGRKSATGTLEVDAHG